MTKDVHVESGVFVPVLIATSLAIGLSQCGEDRSPNTVNPNELETVTFVNTSGNECTAQQLIGESEVLVSTVECEFVPTETNG